jgi:hypothetical protein
MIEPVESGCSQRGYVMYLAIGRGKNIAMILFTCIQDGVISSAELPEQGELSLRSNVPKF